MSLLRALLRASRMIRHAPRLAEGLPPDDAVLLDAPDDRIAPALVAAALGEYEPAAKLLATTRDAAEWESRDRYVMRLAYFAHSRGDWLSSWLATAPRDPDALTVKAELAVRRAWESPARAERLREIGPLIDAAAEATPGDPVPWRIALDHARGTHASHTAFGTLWEQAVRRSPHHYGCHVAALRYLSAQWYGSHRECFDFAEQAAADALPGSLVQALPVRAAFARLEDGTPAAGPLEDERTDAAATRAVALSAAYPAGDLWPAEVRNLTAYVLVRRGRWEEALEQFRLIGPCATSFPWNRFSEDPLDHFLDARGGVRIQVASMTPLRTGTRESGRAAH
ncbi:membrane protein [Streptomyces yaizuensis]|uniref:Membrane protein n=2 Tax=Streptomyces yaizuensis TaxID=2989713 RepID=A0ABQ5NV30_9ACTN|nr:membrane protein [Streptomyces sp. YSPA8]